MRLSCIMAGLAAICVCGCGSSQQCLSMRLSYAGNAEGPVRYSFTITAPTFPGGAGTFSSVEDALSQAGGPSGLQIGCGDPSQTIVFIQAWIDTLHDNKTYCPTGVLGSCAPSNEPSGETTVDVDAGDNAVIDVTIHDPPKS